MRGLKRLCMTKLCALPATIVTNIQKSTNLTAESFRDAFSATEFPRIS